MFKIVGEINQIQKIKKSGDNNNNKIQIHGERSKIINKIKIYKIITNGNKFQINLKLHKHYKIMILGVIIKFKRIKYHIIMTNGNNLKLILKLHNNYKIMTLGVIIKFKRIKF